MNEQSTTEAYTVTGDQRCQAIALAYALAATALERAAHDARLLHPDFHGAAAHAQSHARRVMSGYIDDYETDTGEALSPVIGRMAEAVMEAELHLLDARLPADRVAGQLAAGADIYDQIAQANI